MFHSQIAAPSARSSRHHPSLRPPPKHTHARFYVVSSGKAGLSSLAAANSFSCSFYSPRKSNMAKRETKCVSIWLREEEEEEGGEARPGCEMEISPRHPPVPQSVGQRPGHRSHSALPAGSQCPHASAGEAIQLPHGARRRAMATHTILFGGLETTAFRKGREVARSFCPTFSHFLPQQQKAKVFGEAAYLHSR